MVSTAARFLAAAGNTEALESLLRQLVDNAATESGTLSYVLNVEDSDPAAFWMYEIYADVAAQKAHGAGSVLQRLLPEILPLLADPPTIVRMQVLASARPA